MKIVQICYRHNYGDCVNFARLCQPYLRRRDYDIQLAYDDNKTGIFEAAGFPCYGLERATEERWLPHGRKNLPFDGHDERMYSNVGIHIGQAPLPPVANPDADWQEICNTSLDGRAELWVAQRKMPFPAGTERWLPLIAINTHGDSHAHAKNYGWEESVRLYELLLAECKHNLLLLDWNDRAPLIEHPRVKQAKRDLDKIDLRKLWPLLVRCSLIISVDSGPWHYSALTNVLCLAIFHGHHPMVVGLPRKKTTCLVSDRFADTNARCEPHWNLGIRRSDADSRDDCRHGSANDSERLECSACTPLTSSDAS